MTFGSTPNGQDWCVKALHPSDPMTEVRGIPDKSAVPSILMNYQATFKITPPNTTDTWSFDLSMIPHPVAFGYWSKNNAELTAPSKGNFLNPQLLGETHWAKYKDLCTSFRRWRLAYQAFTVYQDGPDLANQGTIVVCQKPVVPYRFNFAPTRLEYGNGVVADAYGTQPVCVLDTIDLPDYTRSQGMPNAYFSKSKEGAYVPLKLTRTCQEWRSRENSVRWNNSTNLAVSDNYGTVLNMLPQNPSDLTHNSFPFTDLLVGGIAQEAHTPAPPALVSLGSPVGQETSDLLNDTWADISAQNLSPQTSFSIFVRFGLECQVVPSSPLAPHQKLSPMHDKVALETYFAIARELKDAYPSDYNDLGKIWDVISKAAKFVSPFIGAIPGVGGGIATGINLATGAGDFIREKLRKKKEDAPAATRERALQARDAVNAIRASNNRGPLPAVLG